MRRLRTSGAKLGILVVSAAALAARRKDVDVAHAWDRARLSGRKQLPVSAARMHNHTRLGQVVALAAGALLPLAFAYPSTAYAASDINGVIESIRTWVAGILAALATLFLTIGGLRYLIASGNPRAVEEGKAAIRSALIGYALAALSPMLIDILRRVLGT